MNDSRLRPLPAGRRRGLTLLEVLIAIALVTLLLGSLFAFFWDMLSIRRHVVAETDRARAVSILVESVERDLLTTVVGDELIGAGVKGDEAGLALLSRAVPARLAGRDAFVDLERSAYRFDRERSEITAERSPVAGGGASAPPFALAGAVHHVRFRYHDGARWDDTFDSIARERLPAAVEIAVWFDPGLDRPPDRVRVIAIPDWEADDENEAEEQPAAGPEARIDETSDGRDGAGGAGAAGGETEGEAGAETGGEP